MIAGFISFLFFIFYFIFFFFFSHLFGIHVKLHLNGNWNPVIISPPSSQTESNKNARTCWRYEKKISLAQKMNWTNKESALAVAGELERRDISKRARQCFLLAGNAGLNSSQVLSLPQLSHWPFSDPNQEDFLLGEISVALPWVKVTCVCGTVIPCPEGRALNHIVLGVNQSQTMQTVTVAWLQGWWTLEWVTAGDLFNPLSLKFNVS